MRKQNEKTEPNPRATPLLYTVRITIRLGDTDAAGRWFYPRWIELAHQIYEDWLDHAGIPLVRILAMPVILPIVRCEADFLKPALLGDYLDCALSLVELKEKAFTLECTARRDGLLVARSITTHVAVDKSTTASVALPDILRTLLDNKLAE